MIYDDTEAPPAVDTDGDGWNATVSMDGVYTVHFHLSDGRTVQAPAPQALQTMLRQLLVAALDTDGRFRRRP